MKIKHTAVSTLLWPLLGTLILPTFFCGCSQKADVDRFRIVFTPSQSKAPDLVYMIDTATGRLWSRGIARETNKTDGAGGAINSIEYSDWHECKIAGLNTR